MSQRIAPEILARADRHYGSCMLCEHRCGVDREFPNGKCHASSVPRVFRHRVECGEETGLNPCQLFYLSGCDLRCVFCINELSSFDSSRGYELTPAYFQKALAAGQARGARTLQWVGGEPTIHLPAILKVMSTVENLPMVIWKTDLHATPESLELLAGIVDIYIADFKFGNDNCARRITGIAHYCQILKRNLQLLRGQGRVIVRHLLLPGHEECCWQPIAEWMGEHMPEVEVSLRGGYLPYWRAKHFMELANPLEKGAFPRAIHIARALSLRVIT